MSMTAPANSHNNYIGNFLAAKFCAVTLAELISIADGSVSWVMVRGILFLNFVLWAGTSVCS